MTVLLSVTTKSSDLWDHLVFASCVVQLESLSETNPTEMDQEEDLHQVICGFTLSSSFIPQPWTK